MQVAVAMAVLARWLQRPHVRQPPRLHQLQARDGGVHHQGLQRAAQRGLALGIDEHGPGHDYMRVLARRCGAHLALRGLTRRVLFSQPVLLATMSFFHGSNAIGVDADAPADGPECVRDRPGM